MKRRSWLIPVTKNGRPGMITAGATVSNLKITAMKVMCQCFYISELRDDIFSALFQNMTQTDDPKLMKGGEECIEVFLAGAY